MSTEHMIDRRSHGYRFAFLAVLAVSLMARLIFWFLTHYTIEDALIISRMVRNFVAKGELAFNVGERVSASTSPLFAVLASGIAWLGADPLVAAKILGLFASTATCVCLFDLLCEFAPPAAAAIVSGFTRSPASWRWSASPAGGSSPPSFGARWRRWFAPTEPSCSSSWGSSRQYV